MEKKWICPVCGYVHVGETAPEKCPQCKVPGSKFKLVEETGALQFVTEHVIGVANDIPDGSEGDFVRQGLKDHFMGECTEVHRRKGGSRRSAGDASSVRQSCAPLLPDRRCRCRD